MRIFESVVRGIYLATILGATILALGLAALLLYPIVTVPGRYDVGRMIGIVSVVALLTAAFCLPAARALLRRRHEGRVLPDALIRERPVVALVATCTGGLANVLFLVVCAALIAAILAPRWSDDFGMIAGPIFASLCLHAISLLTGEIVLVGRRPAHRSPRLAS